MRMAGSAQTRLVQRLGLPMKSAEQWPPIGNAVLREVTTSSDSAAVERTDEIRRSSRLCPASARATVRPWHMGSTGTLEGRELGSIPWSDTLEKTKAVARNGLAIHGADIVRIIIDVAGSNVEVWSERRDILDANAR